MKSENREKWLDAEKTELDSLAATNTYKLTEIPPGVIPIGSKWVYKTKLNSDGSIERFKARLVAQGYTQEYGIDYTETYAPVVRGLTLRWLIAMATIQGWSMKLVDAITAYLNSKLAEPLHMQAPKGYETELGYCWLLLNALYGLKQSGRLWYQTLTTFFKESGYFQSKADPCVFFKVFKSGPVYIAIYVDDLPIFGNIEAVNETIQILANRFKIRDLGDLTYCIGIQISQKKDYTFIHQTAYADAIITRFEKIIDNGPNSTPICPNFKPISSTPTSTPVDQTSYLEAIGCLNYLAVNTRPDLSLCVSYLASFSQKPMSHHWDQIIRCLRYVKKTRNYGIKYEKHGNNSPIGYADASFAVHEKGKSQLSHIIMFANGPITWRSYKSALVNLSTTEAEYTSLSDLCRELQSLINIYSALCIPITLPLSVNEDNKGAIAMAVSDLYTAKSRHIALRYHHVRDMISNNIVRVDYIPTSLQLADLLTKPLPRIRISDLLLLLNLLPTST